VILMHTQSNLAEIRLALRSPGRCADFLYGRQEQTDQHGDDGDHHQELDERERTSLPHGNLRGQMLHSSCYDYHNRNTNPRRQWQEEGGIAKIQRVLTLDEAAQKSACRTSKKLTQA